MSTDCGCKIKSEPEELEKIRKRSANYYGSFASIGQALNSASTDTERLLKYIDSIELDRSQCKYEHFKTMGTIEVMCENVNVDSWVKEHEEQIKELESANASLVAERDKQKLDINSFSWDRDDLRKQLEEMAQERDSLQLQLRAADAANISLVHQIERLKAL